MFSSSLKTLTTIITSLIIFTSFASAQWGIPDLTGIDLNAVLAGQMQQTQGALNGVMYDAMQQRGPEIQSAYNACLQSGQYCGSFDEYALNYVSTNGFTDGGAWAKQNQTNIANEQNAWQGVQAAEQGYRDAYGNYTGGFSENMNEAGTILMGNATYYTQGGSAQGSTVLPYGWQANSYNTYNGQSYYVDYSGQYYQIDPNNSGWMYPINQGQ
jgi:hypothetical protein